MKRLLLTLIYIFLFLCSNLYASEKKDIGKFLGAKNTHMPTWFLNSFLDLNEDIEELKENNKRLILYIHQDSCPYCYKFINTNLKDINIKKSIDKNFEILALNMFGDREIVDTDEKTYTEKEFALKYKVQFTPTLIFFNEQKEEVLRLNGYINTKQLQNALSYVSNKKEKNITYKEYLLKNVKEKNILLKQDKDLFLQSRNFLRNKSSKEMVIFFESDNCINCDNLHKNLLQNKTTRTLLKKIDVYQVNINSKKSIITPQKYILKTKDWADKLNLKHLPSVIFFDNRGKEIIRIESSFKTFHFQSIIDYVTSKAYKTENEFQRYLSKRAETIREKGIDVNIWE